MSTQTQTKIKRTRIVKFKRKNNSSSNKTVRILSKIRIKNSQGHIYYIIEKALYINNKFKKNFTSIDWKGPDDRFKIL